MGEACAKYFGARAGAFHLQQFAAASIGHRRDPKPKSAQFRLQYWPSILASTKLQRITEEIPAGGLLRELSG